MTKNFEELLTKHTEDVKRHFDVAMEHFDGQVRLIAEQYDDIKKTLNSHTEMIASVKEDVEIMKIDIAFIKSGLRQKVDVEEFNVLEKRVAILEAKAIHK